MFYFTQEESHSGGTSVEFYTNVTLLSTLMSQWWQYATRQCNINGSDSTVTMMAATLVCHRCKLTTVQQRWQWQHYNTTAHTSVTAVTTDSTMTAMFTLVWQRCAHHCESSGNWQHCHTNVHITVTALSAATGVTALSVFTAVTALSAVITVTLM